MALDLTPSKLFDAVNRSLKLRRSHTELAHDRLRRYATPGFRRGYGSDGWQNQGYQWCSIIVPHLAWMTPSVRVSDMGITDQETETIQTAMQCWMEQVDLVEQLRLVAYDQQFVFGLLYACMEPTPGLKMPDPSGFVPMRPKLQRLSPMLYFEDCDGPMYGGARFAGHILVKDMADLEREIGPDGQPKYDLAALMTISEGDVTEIEKDLLQHDGLSIAGIDKPVVLYEVWCKEAKAMITMAAGGNGAVIVRGEREYVGDAVSGPYEKFGVHIVPDQVYPLPPLAISEKQTEELNKHREQASRDAGTAKRLAIANTTSKEQVVNVANAMSGDIIMAPGFNGTVSTFEFGGPMKETLGYIDWSEGKLQQLTGLTDPLLGDVNGDATATENALAGQYADVRLKYATGQFIKSTAKALRKIVAIMDRQEDVIFPVSGDQPVMGPDGSVTMQKTRGTFYGGPSGNGGADPMYPWERAYTVKIEPYSMEYVNQSLLRLQTQAAQEHVLKITQAAASGLPINVGKMIDDMFETLNMPNTARKYVDLQMLQMLGAMNIAAQSVQAGGGPGEGGGPNAGKGPKQPSQTKNISTKAGNVEAPV